MSDDAGSRRKFQVIEGGSQKPSIWKVLPSSVIARSPFDKNTAVRLRISQDNVRKQLEIGRKQLLFDAWSAIYGSPPPIPNIESQLSRLELHPLTSLYCSYACFRGVNRPVGSDNRGYDTFVYVNRASHIFRYAPNMVCQAELYKVPSDLVFATYVRQDRFNQTGAFTDAGGVQKFSGVITHWEFVEQDESEPSLPQDFLARYRRRLW